jgi:purine nucleoside permease
MKAGDIVLNPAYPFTADGSAPYDLFSVVAHEAGHALGLPGNDDPASVLFEYYLDPRFDLRSAYWLVAGIAGANPDRAPLASAIWAEWIVDGDLAFEIDAREIPPDWSTGYVPLFGTHPFQEPPPPDDYGPVYRLNPATVDWAYELTRGMALPDPEGLRAWRSQYAGHPGAALTPRVMRSSTSTPR